MILQYYIHLRAAVVNCKVAHVSCTLLLLIFCELHTTTTQMLHSILENNVVNEMDRAVVVTESHNEFWGVN